MTPFEVILSATSEGAPAVKAKDLTFSIGFDSGSVQVRGEQDFSIINGQTVTKGFDNSIMLNEQAQLIPSMPEGAGKALQQAKYNLWNTLFETIKPMVEEAIKAQYLLDNPVPEGGENE